MDREQGSHTRGGIPRLSRLPLPRGQGVAPEIHQDDSTKSSQLPRPNGGSWRLPNTNPLSESVNKSIKSRYGWSDRTLSARNRSPVRDALQASQSVSLDTTPPNTKFESVAVEDGDENYVSSKPEQPHLVPASREKRRPRPSLSERTIKTLLQIPPSPSPTRRRSSTVNSNGSMGPPSRPTTAMKMSRPTTPSGRPKSPSKRPFKPPGRSVSPVKDIGFQSATPTMDNIYTPPRAFMRDRSSRIAKPLRETRRSLSTAMTETPEERPARKPTSQTVKVKSMYDLRGVAARSANSQPPLSSLFKNPPPPPQSSGKLAIPGLEQKNGLLRPRSPGENTVATAPKAVSRRVKQPAAPVAHPSSAPVSEEVSSMTPKSSVSLRETIAKAKAARKAESTRSQSSSNKTFDPIPWTADDIPAVAVSQNGNSGLLRKRIEGAVVTGSLNIAAMGLKDIPEQVMKMYDFSENSKINWSEAVDLVKLIAADNDIQELSDVIFPDWSPEEMIDDEEKSNQFGGLEFLDIHGNKLSSLPIGFRRLERLQTLNLSSNSLSADVFDVICEIRNLRRVHLASNSLKGPLTMHISQLQQLEVLDLHGNELTSLPESISQLISLQTLNVSGNKLQALPLQALSGLPLIELNVSKNLLSGTLFEQVIELPKLQILDASSNTLTCISTAPLELPALRSLSIQQNRLTCLPDLSVLQSLFSLIVSANRLTELPEGFTKLSSLKSADFSSNSVKVIESGIATMENLTALNLGGNPLREKKYLTMNADDIRSDLAKKMMAANVSAPMSILDDIPLSLTSAGDGTDGVAKFYRPSNGVLDLSSRNLATVDICEVDLDNTSTKPIHTIRLSNNELTCFPIELLSHPSIKQSLKSLDISHNPLLHSTDYLTADISLPLLQSLYIVSTGLTSLDALTVHLKAPQLKELNLSCHRLTGSVPWVRDWFPSLTTLLATDNWFNSIDLEAVRGLEVLDVRNNEIDKLPPKIGLLGNRSGRLEPGRLRTIEVSGNRFRVPRIATVEKGSEAVLRDLRRMVPLDEVTDEWKEEM